MKTWCQGSVAREGLEFGLWMSPGPLRERCLCHCLQSHSSSVIWRHGVGGEQDLFMIPDTGKNNLAFPRVVDLESGGLILSHGCHLLIIKTSASNWTSRRTSPTIQWQYPLMWIHLAQCLVKLVPSFIKAVLQVWRIFVMDFCSAWRHKVFSADASNSMAFRLSVRTPIWGCLVSHLEPPYQLWPWAHYPSSIYLHFIFVCRMGLVMLVPNS